MMYSTSFFQAGRLVALGGVVFVGIGAVVVGTRGLTHPGTPSASRRSPPGGARLIAQQAGIYRLNGLSLPVLRYEVAIPGTVDGRTLSARLVGTGGDTLRLTLLEASGGRVVFGRTGYRKAPREPKLVLRSRVADWFQHPVDRLPDPVRAIPLVVPLDARRGLRQDPSVRVTEPSSLAPAPTAEPAHAYRYAEPRTARSEWSLGISRTGWSIPRVARCVTIPPCGYFWLHSSENDGIAEVEAKRTQILRESADATLDLEIYREANADYARIAEPIEHRFTNGAVLKIPAQSVPLNRSERDGGRRELRLEATEIPGYPGLTPAGTESAIRSYGGSEQDRSYRPIAGAWTDPRLSIRLRNRIGGLGLDDLSVGRWSFRASDARRPIRYGRHRLDLRLFCRKVVRQIERSYVRIATDRSANTGME